MKKISIIATLGPLTSSVSTISALIDAGATMMRLNFSWGDHAGMKAIIDAVRAVEKDRGIVVPIIQDLSGPRMVTSDGHGLDTTSHSVITEKDKQDLVFGLQEGVQYVALSFVKDASDVHELRQMMAEQGQMPKVIAKIERKEALDNLDELVEHADGIMVARGDLGQAMPIEELPSLEKRIIDRCNEQGKFVIVATQMMLSMIESKEPTRAEVMDVATAVALGADAVMLSEETSTGKFPVETVAEMRKIVDYAQEHH